VGRGPIDAVYRGLYPPKRCVNTCFRTDDTEARRAGAPNTGSAFLTRTRPGSGGSVWLPLATPKHPTYLYLTDRSLIYSEPNFAVSEFNQY